MTRVRKWVASFEIFLCVAYFNMAMINMGAISVLPAIFKVDISNQNTTTIPISINLMMSFIMGSRSLTYVLSTPVFCILCQYVAPIIITFIGLSIEILSCIFMAISVNFEVFLMGRLIEGIGACAVTISTFVLIFKEFRNFSARSWQMGMTSLCRIVGNYTTPVIFAVTYSYTQESAKVVCFTIAASINIINIFIFYHFFSNRYNLPVEQLDDSSTIVEGRESLSFSTFDSLQFNLETSFSVRIMEKIGCIYFLLRAKSTILQTMPLTKFTQLLANPHLLLALLCLICSHMPYFLLLPTLSLWLANKNDDFDTNIQGFVWLAPLLFTILGSILGTFIFNQLKLLKYLAVILCLMAAICNVALPFIDDLWLIMIVTGYFAFQLTTMKFILLPTIANYAEVKSKPIYRSLPIIYFTCVEIASTISCFISGPIVDRFSYTILNFSSAVFMVILSPLTFILNYSCVADFL